MQKKKYQSLKVRAISTVIFIASFCVIIYMGHVPLMLMILAIQVINKTAAVSRCMDCFCCQQLQLALIRLGNTFSLCLANALHLSLLMLPEYSLWLCREQW